MEELKAYLLMTSLGVMIVNTPFYFYCFYRFNSHMEVMHRRKWEELGSFHMILNNSISNGIAMIGFLLKKRYLKIEGDFVLHTKANKCRVSLFVGLISFFISLILIFTF